MHALEAAAPVPEPPPQPAANEPAQPAAVDREMELANLRQARRHAEAAAVAPTAAHREMDLARLERAHQEMELARLERARRHAEAAALAPAAAVAPAAAFAPAAASQPELREPDTPPTGAWWEDAAARRSAFEVRYGPREIERARSARARRRLEEADEFDLAEAELERALDLSLQDAAVEEIPTASARDAGTAESPSGSSPQRGDPQLQRHAPTEGVAPTGWEGDLATVLPPVPGAERARFRARRPRDTTCAICLGDLRGGRPLACGHCFHARCITEWLERAGTCPCCRAAV